MSDKDAELSRYRFSLAEYVLETVREYLNQKQVLEHDNTR